MQHRAGDLQRRTGPRAAAAGALIALAAGAASADPEAPQPAVTHHGWQVAFTGYIQADAIVASESSADAVSSTGAPLNEDRFLIRRGRLHADARQGPLSTSIEFDGNTSNGPIARLLGANVGWQYKPSGRRLPLVAITAGLLKTPFGVEVPSSEREKPFLEAPAFARALVPGNYDGGIVAHGAYGIARWSVGLMNDAPVGDAQWKGKDPTASREVVGRLGAAIDGPLRLRFEVGVSGLSGSALHAGTPATKDQLTWIDDNMDGIVQTTELRGVPGASATPSETFSHHGLGADAQVHWCVCRLGEGTAFAEAVLATNLDRALVYADPVAASRDYRERGFSVGVVQNLGAYAQAGVRYDRYNADRGEHRIFSTLSVMATARWHEARVVAQYDHDRNPLARADDGSVFTRAADRLTLRAQMGF